MTRQCITHHYACDCREAKFAEMEKDAMRWRFFRDGASASWDMEDGKVRLWMGGANACSGNTLEEAVDAAMQQESEG